MIIVVRNMKMKQMDALQNNMCMSISRNCDDREPERNHMGLNM